MSEERKITMLEWLKEKMDEFRTEAPTVSVSLNLLPDVLDMSFMANVTEHEPIESEG